MMRCRLLYIKIILALLEFVCTEFDGLTALCLQSHCTFGHQASLADHEAWDADEVVDDPVRLPRPFPASGGEEPAA